METALRSHRAAGAQRHRQAERSAAAATDLALSHPDPQLTRLISRAHFELQRAADGLLLRALSSQATAVDGQPLAPGEARPVYAGSRIAVAGVLTLLLQAEPPRPTLAPPLDSEATVLAGPGTRVGASGTGTVNLPPG